MTDNYGRHTLITRFFCADCGAPLNLTYDKANEAYQSGDPTGAAVRYNALLVVPCAGCIGKHTAPAKRLADAVQELVGSKA